MKLNEILFFVCKKIPYIQFSFMHEHTWLGTNFITFLAERHIKQDDVLYICVKSVKWNMCSLEGMMSGDW